MKANCFQQKAKKTNTLLDTSLSKYTIQSYTIIVKIT